MKVRWDEMRWWWISQGMPGSITISLACWAYSSHRPIAYVLSGLAGGIWLTINLFFWVAEDDDRCGGYCEPE